MGEINFRAASDNFGCHILWYDDGQRCMLFAWVYLCNLSKAEVKGSTPSHNVVAPYSSYTCPVHLLSHVYSHDSIWSSDPDGGSWIRSQIYLALCFQVGTLGLGGSRYGSINTHHIFPPSWAWSTITYQHELGPAILLVQIWVVPLWLLVLTLGKGHK